MGDRDTFGEGGLLLNSSRRTASVITNTPCIFGIVHKNHYKKLVQDIEKV